jgi:hypothetical protein
VRACGARQHTTRNWHGSASRSQARGMNRNPARMRATNFCHNLFHPRRCTTVATVEALPNPQLRTGSPIDRHAKGRTSSRARSGSNRASNPDTNCGTHSASVYASLLSDRICGRGHTVNDHVCCDVHCARRRHSLSCQHEATHQHIPRREGVVQGDHV